MTLRAERRHHLDRMKAKAHRVYGRRIPHGAHHKVANHMAHCSDWCCGNPRRWFGEMTMQERRRCDDVTDD